MTMLNDIKNRISVLVGGMTKTGGYHFDWGDVNVYDNQENYPSAKVIYIEESNLDDSQNRGVSRNQYHNEVIFNIKCEYQNPQIDDVDSFEQVTKMDEDLKKIFGINHSFTSFNGGYAFYLGHRPVFQQNSDLPCGIDWQLKVRYYQKRNDPSVYI